MQNIIYHLDSKEAEFVVQELKEEFKKVKFVRLKASELDLRKCIMHPKDLPEKAALIWGSGLEHHYSLAITPDKPFVKSVDDGHSDIGNPAKQLSEPPIDCQHHNLSLLRYSPYIREVEIRGNFAKWEQKYDSDKSLYAHSGQSRLVPSALPVHKSIDLDVIKGFPARLSWQDDSFFSLESVAQDLERLCKDGTVKRFDIGGLYFPKNIELELYHFNHWQNPLKNKEALNFAIRCHSELINIFLRN